MYGVGIVTKPGKEPAERNTGMLAAGAYAACGAVWSAFLSVFPVGVSPFFVYGLQAAAVLLWALVFGGRKGRKSAGAALAAGGVLAVTAFYHRTLVGLGLNHLVNQYILRHNEFRQADRELFEDTRGAGLLLTLFLVQMVMGAVFVMVLRFRRGALLAVLLLAMPLLLAVTVGEIPATVSVWESFGAGLLYFLIYRSRDSRRLKGELIVAAPAFAVAVLVGTAVQPFIVKVRDKNEEGYIEIHNRLLDAQSADLGAAFSSAFRGNANYATGGVGKGDLRNLAENRPKGTTDLVVTADRFPGEMVYLKAYVGSEYTGEKWEEPSQKELKRALRKKGTSLDEEALFGEPFDRIERGRNDLEREQIAVRLENASSAYAYSPYYAQTGAGDSVYADAYIRGKGKGSRVYTCYKMRDVRGLESERIARESEAWKAYRQYVKGAYTALPEGLEKVEAYCAGFSGRDAGEVSDEISRSFYEGFSYSLKPGAYPDNEDLAEYFLTESKRGFCVHFATAATLIYRARGVPARYVEGYAVPAEAFTQQGDGTWKAVVTDAMAHAWSETFDSNLGWQVREHTFSAAGYDRAAVTENAAGDVEEDTTGDAAGTGREEETVQPKEPEQSGQTPEETQKQTEGQETSGGGNGNSGKASGKSKTAGVSVPVVLGSVAGAAVLLLVLWNIRRRKRRKRFGIRNIYSEVCAIAAFAGVLYREENERETVERMKEAFPQLKPEEWEWMYECARRAAFSNEQPTKARQQKMYHLYIRFRESIVKELSTGRRLLFLYWKGL